MTSTVPILAKPYIPALAPEQARSPLNPLAKDRNPQYPRVAKAVPIYQLKKTSFKNTGIWDTESCAVPLLGAGEGLGASSICDSFHLASACEWGIPCFKISGQHFAGMISLFTPIHLQWLPSI
jgi:hypothetical protein